jgi:hypothetical protein
MPLFGVGIKPKTDDKGYELTQKRYGKGYIKSINNKKRQKGIGDFPPIPFCQQPQNRLVSVKFLLLR